MYSKTARLPMEGEVLSKSTLLDKVITLIHKLLLFRESARIAIKRVQKKIRQDYPVWQSIKFQLRDQVLYDDSLNYYTKLKKKWIGLWIIIKVLYNRTYKVADHVGVQKQSINRDHLKRYYVQDESQIIIIQN